jgi:UDP-N-acetyl-D-galactosamine dehydrogenase
MFSRDHKIKGAKVLILGITFKENCPDICNTRVVDIVHELKQYGVAVDIYDPWAHSEEVMHAYHLKCFTSINRSNYEAIILVVAHDLFKTLDIRALAEREDCVLYDIKGALPAGDADGRL